VIGKTVSHYKIISKIGEGGMGVVYKALDTTLDRHVAIKFLPPQLRSDKQAQTRFVHEAKAASALNHANIAVVHEVDETPEGQMFIVMAYYEGQTLQDKLQGGALSADEAIAIVSQIASGLSKAHEKDILHRDIKPANILLGDDGHAKIADFGLAKLAGQTKVTKTGTTVGTVAYMSPEQASGRDIDHRSDIFSLGVVLYELLTGRLPFRGDHEAAVLYGIMNSDPEPLASETSDLPPGLQQVVEKALIKEPGSRYRTAADMQADLDSIRIGAGVGSQSAHRRSQGNKRLAVLIVAVALAAVAGYAGITRFWSSEQAPRMEGNADLVTIAVLPFVNMSSDTEQEYFSDGLTEELMNVLVKIPELRVTGRTSSFSFKGKNEDLRTIGQKLNVAHILEGSVRKSGDEIRITAQLVKADDGFHLWSETYDKTALDDVFAIQDDIARSVAQALEVSLLGRSTSETESQHVAAYDLIQRARFVLRNRSFDDLPRAREMVQRAVTIDPNYAPAWVAMGLVHANEYGLALTGTTDNPHAADSAQHVALQARQEAYERALSIDPELAVAHSGMAMVHLLSSDFEAAERSIDRALQLDPRSPDVMRNAARLYESLGRFVEMVALEERVLKAEPLVVSGYASLASSYLLVGRLEEGVMTCRKAQELEPDNFIVQGWLGRILLERGLVDEARAAWSHFDELVPDRLSPAMFERSRLWRDALLEHTAGNTTEADSAMQQFEDKFAAISLTGCAEIRAWRGETDAAFAWLERAFEAQDQYLKDLKSIPELRSLHSDPRWNDLLERIGLPTN